MDICAYWDAVARQDAVAMRRYFAPDAVVRWHNTNELFTVEEFIQANCAYPGQWAGQVERAEAIGPNGSRMVAVVHVWAVDGTSSHHVTSFFEIKDDTISALDEYWGDDGPAPGWRREMGLGRPIRAV